MSSKELPDNITNAALTFRVPEKIGWSIQNGQESNSGSEIGAFLRHLDRETGKPVTLSLTFIVEVGGEK